MKKSNIILIAIAIVVVIAGMSLWNQRGDAVFLETKIQSQHTSNKSNYDAMWKRFTEMAQVTELQAEQFKDVYTDMISGRYEGDTSLLFKSIQEQNPSLGTEVYTKLQNEISAGRTQFDNNQKKVIDLVGEYNRLVQHNGILMAMITGRHPLDPNDYIVTSVRTDNAFETGKDDVIDLKGGK